METNSPGSENPIPPIESSPTVSEKAQEEEEALLGARVRAIRREMLLRDVERYAKLGIVILITGGLGLSIIVFLIHSLTNWGWLEPKELQKVEELFRFGIVAFSFFLAGKHSAIGRFLSGNSDDWRFTSSIVPM